jgi:hypothetical protein
MARQATRRELMSARSDLVSTKARLDLATVEISREHQARDAIQAELNRTRRERLFAEVNGAGSRPSESRTSGASVNLPSALASGENAGFWKLQYTAAVEQV